MITSRFLMPSSSTDLVWAGHASSFLLCIRCCSFDSRHVATAGGGACDVHSSRQDNKTWVQDERSNRN